MSARLSCAAASSLAKASAATRWRRAAAADRRRRRRWRSRHIAGSGGDASGSASEALCSVTYCSSWGRRWEARSWASREAPLVDLDARRSRDLGPFVELSLDEGRGLLGVQCELLEPELVEPRLVVFRREHAGQGVRQACDDLGGRV